jgi:hypothetical protein
MQDLLAQIQSKLGQIKTTASNLPAGTDVSQASQSIGGMTNQVKSVMANAMPKVIPADTTQAPPPPTFQASQPPDDLSLKAQVDKQRAELEATYRTQLEEANKRIAEAEKIQAEMRAKQEGVLGEADPLTQPFREDLEKAERERLKIEENYFANQALTNELDRLLTESIEMTRKLQTQKVPGLAGLQQSSRMVKAQEGVQSRIAVIEAVMAARNNQIGVATTFIDRSLRNIQQDRQDRLGYLENLFNFYETTRTEEGKKIFNLTQDQKAIIQEQTNLIKTDLARAEAVADRIREIILSNPTMAHEAGLSLNDTMDEITKKIANYSLTQERKEMDNQMAGKGYKVLSPEMAVGKPESELVRLIDANGNERVYWNTQPDLLSVAEAKSLGVPYGTTKKGAYGKMPVTTSTGTPPGPTPGSTPGTPLGGLNFSSETRSVLVGTQDINKLTPAKRQAVISELTEKLALHKEEVNPSFKSLMNDLFDANWTDDELKEMWNGLREELGIKTITSDDGDSGSELREAWGQEMGGLQKESKNFMERLMDPKWYKPWTWGK